MTGAADVTIYQSLSSFYATDCGHPKNRRGYMRDRCRLSTATGSCVGDLNEPMVCNELTSTSRSRLRRGFVGEVRYTFGTQILGVHGVE